MPSPALCVSPFCRPQSVNDAGVRAPREIRPNLPMAGREETLRRLEGAASELEASCLQDPRGGTLRLSHPYFGALPAPDLIRILAWHALHHRAQLPGVASFPQ